MQLRLAYFYFMLSSALLEFSIVRLLIAWQLVTGLLMFLLDYRSDKWM